MFTFNINLGQVNAIFYLLYLWHICRELWEIIGQSRRSPIHIQSQILPIPHTIPQHSCSSCCCWSREQCCCSCPAGSSWRSPVHSGQSSDVPAVSSSLSPAHLCSISAPAAATTTTSRCCSSCSSRGCTKPCQPDYSRYHIKRNFRNISKLLLSRYQLGRSWSCRTTSSCEPLPSIQPGQCWRRRLVLPGLHPPWSSNVCNPLDAPPQSPPLQRISIQAVVMSQRWINNYQFDYQPVSQL